MNRSNFRKLTAAGFTAAVLLAFIVNPAQAGRRLHHSGGSSGVSYGSWGSHGCHGGYYHRHRHHRVRYHHSHGCWGSSGGSYGSWGSSGGSYGSWGSSGGSYGSWGSSGGSSGGYIVPPTQPAEQPAMPGADADDAPVPPKEATRRSRSATLAVHVPEGAKIFVNGHATTSTGTERRYISRGLSPGYHYSYEVRAELTTSQGKTLKRSKVVQLRAGETTGVSFDWNEVQTAEQSDAQPVATKLTLNVPQQAKVFLAGDETKSTGPVRVFSTMKLSDGQSWSDYSIRVTLDRNGRTLSKEQTITLRAGQSRELTFDFDQTKLAVTTSETAR